jgi:Tol biopolymer transport system component/predicted amidohydrolase
MILPALLLASTVLAQEDEEPDLPLEGQTGTLAFTTDEGSWLSLDVMPDGETIVFDLLGDLYTLPVGGGEATRITSGLGYDSQPTVSPDGQWIAFVSDRNGSDNLWVARADGTDARRVSDDKQWGLVSPAWAPDSRTIIVTKTAQSVELWLYHIDGGGGITLAASDPEEKFWGVGAVVSPDGQYAYFAKAVDNNGQGTGFPAAQINRYRFATGEIDQLTQAEGGALRPALSPDGRQMVYATRRETETGFRIRDLVTGDDRWLTWPVQRDAQENFRPPSRDVLPGYTFTPDGSAIIFNTDGGIWRADIDTGNRSEIPFTAEVSLDIGPDLTSPYRVPQGDITATLIHDPKLSPDQDRIATSVLTKIYVADADGSDPERLTSGDAWEFKPVWSPDGRWIAYVTWSMNDGGHIWRMRSNGSGRPQQLTDIPAFYTDLRYGPDGETLYAMRGSEYMRHQTFSEFGGLRVSLDLVSVPADGGPQSVIMPANGARYPHFGPEPDRVYMTDETGLFSVQLDGTDRREELVVTAPRGNRRGEEPPKAESILISPDGRYVLAHANKQVWAVGMARIGGKAPVVDLRKGVLPVARLTDIGADFYGWTPGGDLWWSIGNSLYTRPFESVAFREEDDDEAESEADEEEVPFVAKDEHESVTSASIDVVVPRNTPSGSMLLSGVNLISMNGESTDDMNTVLTGQDILVTDNRIAAIGPTGSLTVPDDATTIDVSGRYVVPGFVDTHAHWEFRTGDVLEPQNWTLVANLVYGVTAGLDVQTASHDYLAYRDFVETGQSIGQRAFMTARGIFGDTDFQSYDATHAYLRRYSDHYHTKNIKSYIVGNRKQRQWVVLASQDLGLMPTTEGGADQRLNLTHAIDGMHGNEHTLPDTPLFRDVVELYARTKTAYTPTLVVQYNATSMTEYFFTREEIHDDRKLARFTPHNRLDEMTRRRAGWQRDDEFNFRQAAAEVAKIQRAGGLVGVGGHGELQGLGFHWEMWGYAMGGMTPAEVLRAATIDGARIIGVAEDLGSIEVGKLADLVILDANPLENIRNTAAIDKVVKDGRLYDGDTADQLWPDEVPLAPFWWWSDEDRRHVPPVPDEQ